jgi:hypothetical protein
MKKLLSFVLMVAICSFVACKKAEEKSATPAKQQTENKQAKNQKRPKKGKGAAPPQALQIYQDDKLVVAISRQEYGTLMTAPIKVNGKDQKGILLSDLLKKHNVTGKNVILHGPNRASTISWDEATTNDIYLYPVRNRLQVFHQSKELEESKIPIVLVRIDVGEKAAPPPPEGKRAAKKK